MRSYSLSSAPGASTYRISVKHEPHGVVSGYLNRELHPGAVLDAAAPRGEFVLSEGANPVLLVSAGIGVTPVLSMLHALAQQHAHRDIWWIHGARDPREQTMGAEAHALLATLRHAHEHVFYSRPVPAGPGREPVASGRLSAGKLAGLGLPPGAYAYICGPAAFMADMRDALIGIGIDASRIHTELFGTLPPINPGVIGTAGRPPHRPAGPVRTGPLVTFARSGISTPFSAPATNLLELAEDCDVPTRWSCRTGVCHTCSITLLSGTVTYSPTPLEPPPDGQALICCARPDTDVVVDL